ncbi:MaoC family dehydratase [Gordonia shandongensis]|uniref:MaoC family dehydratase n=1 Tax=Gordonia shandongensis TaxID=376351 RepID=UPI000404B1E3|nr:MaoC family dehydratase [Gordonia shandongensis]
MTTAPLTFANAAELLDAVGTDLPTGEWISVDQRRVDTFADATDDHQWIHVDPERAAAGPFGGTIAHGYLTLSLIGPMIGDVLAVPAASSILNYGLDRVRFPAPVPVGGRVRLVASIGEIAAVTGGVQVRIDATVECEGSSKPAAVAGVVYRYLF